MSRLIFIGDVHGCAVELESLLALVQPEPGRDRVIFVGDLVDKGPESRRVLDIAQRLQRTIPGSRFIMGNHEDKALRFKKSGKLDLLKDQSWVHDATDEDWAFIESMPLTWYDEGTNTRVVHGGIFPSLLEKHPDVFDKIEARGDKWQKGGGKVMNRARRMLRVRYVGQESGDMLALGENKEGDPFWADVYDGSHGSVIYGHSPWLDGKVRITYLPGTFKAVAAGIDTACVFGGKLTALVIDGDSTTHVSVDAESQYAKPLEGVD